MRMRERPLGGGGGGGGGRGEGKKGAWLSLQLKQDFTNLLLFDPLHKIFHTLSNRKTEFFFLGDLSKMEEACALVRRALATQVQLQRAQRRSSSFSQTSLQPGSSALASASASASGSGSGSGSAAANEEDFELIAPDPDVDSNLYRPRMTTMGQLPLEIVEESEALSTQQLKTVIRCVPARFNLERWTLLYSISRDGVSMNRLFDRAERENAVGTVVVIRDADYKVFGGFASKTWKPHSGFFGSGECFVFQFDNGVMQRYPWSGKNEYWLSANKQHITFGGGNDYAIEINADLSKGSSGACHTYDSPRLTKSFFFSIRVFEVWAPTGGLYNED